LLQTHTALFAIVLTGIVTVYVCAIFRLKTRSKSMFEGLRAERAALETGSSLKTVWEYRSRFELFGLPFIHIRLNSTDNLRSPVKAWIAAGNSAVGVLFAYGSVAVAPVSVGGIAIGLMPVGAVALGVCAVGAFAFGGWAFGAFAFGWQSFGSFAIALNAAMGTLAIARDFALGGGGAHAAQANNEIARQFFKGEFFFQKMEIISRHIVWMNLLWFLPVIAWWRALAKRAGKN